jgi:hypothetical protein
MNKFGFWALAALIVLATVPAFAQGAKPSMDQYPSFIELSSSNSEDTQSVLRCGYMANGSTIALDKGYQEISVMNQAHKSYSRIQRIDDYLIATSIDPSGSQGFLVELIAPNGAVKAKNCQNDAATDTIHDCHSISAFTFADQVKAGDQQVAMQCNELLKQGATQINPATASPQKTEEFKATLRQKVNILAAP